MGLVLGVLLWFCYGLCIPVNIGLQSEARGAGCILSKIQPLGRKQPECNQNAPKDEAIILAGFAVLNALSGFGELKVVLFKV